MENKLDDNKNRHEAEMKIIYEEVRGVDEYIKLHPVLKLLLENKEVYELVKTIVHRATHSGYSSGYARCMEELIDKMNIEGYFETNSEIINILKK